jgi:hypothetical protein
MLFPTLNTSSFWSAGRCTLGDFSNAVPASLCKVEETVLQQGESVLMRNAQVMITQHITEDWNLHVHGQEVVVQF